MATLAQLRRKVQSRLRDWGGDMWEEFELNQILNEAQDQFTRDTGYLRTVINTAMTDGQSVYTLSAPAGYRINETLSVIYFDGVRDYPALIPVSLRQLELMSPDYRHVSGSVPMYYIRNFNPGTATPSNETFYLYPTPDLNYSLYNGTWPLTFTGGGGTNAAGTATFTNGAITATTLTNAGSGYATAPSVALSTTSSGYQFIAGSGAGLSSTLYSVKTATLGTASPHALATAATVTTNTTLGTYTLSYTLMGGTIHYFELILNNLIVDSSSFFSFPPSWFAPNYGITFTFSGAPTGNTNQTVTVAMSSSGNLSSINIVNAGSGYTTGNKFLRVNVTLTTDGQMTTDDTEMALPERVAEEALINYTVAEALMRECMAQPDKTDLFMKQVEYYRSKYLDRMIRAAAEAKSGFDRGMNTTRGWWV